MNMCEPIENAPILTAMVTIMIVGLPFLVALIRVNKKLEAKLNAKEASLSADKQLAA